MKPYLCIHGHFYQPPRENPRSGEVDLEISAAPYHDWNRRITAECYEPNLTARILDSEGHVSKLLNNYSLMSFNFGPTLLSWMEKTVPAVYRAIIASDQASARNFSGHGSALAQAYHHLIMPLANRRDKETQVIWGIKDFIHRFGRKPEGMWLPETAVDSETLELLAAQGLKFTILAPHQARRSRESDGESWQEIATTIDPLRPYRVNLPSGRTLNLFFYEGPISQAIAFQNLLNDGEGFLGRLMSRFDARVEGPQFLSIATDGETYGHHHKFGEMALAYVLNTAMTRKQIKLTNFGEYLALHPPLAEVQVMENSSWSCSHGVERWRSDCGCNVGGISGWNQSWRQPLRRAMNALRDVWAEFYENEGAKLLRDPWTARNEYIDILLTPSPQDRHSYFMANCTHPFDRKIIERAESFLELQRYAMLIFTSCGWFFDDPSGLETQQILRYAKRGIEIVRNLQGPDIETEFLAILAQGHSNFSERGTLADIYLESN